MARISFYFSLFCAGVLAGQSPPPAPAPPQSVAQQPLPSESKPDEGATVAGQVVADRSGTPLRRATINLTPADGKAWNDSTIVLTDGEGKFIIHNVPAGSYQLLAAKNGYAQTAYGAKGPSNGTTLKLEKGQQLLGLKIAVRQQGVITGKVVDDDGEPLANADVAALQRGYSNGRVQLYPAANARTSDLGEYRLYGVAPGHYLVQASYRSNLWGQNISGVGEIYQKAFYPGAVDAASGARLSIDQGTELHNIDFHLSKVKAYKVRGKVTGLPKATDVNLTLLSKNSDAQSEGLYTPANREKGTFEFPAVPAGSYVLTAQAHVDGRFLFGKVAVEVNSPVMEGVAVDLHAGSQILGQFVVEPGAEPLQSATVGLWPMGQVPLTGEVPVKENKFTVKDVFEGKYWLAVTQLRDGEYVRKAMIGDQSLAPDIMDFSSGVPEELKLVIAHDAATLEGEVVGPKDEKPVTGASVVMIPAAEYQSQSAHYGYASTDLSGHYTIKNMPPGRYTLYAVEEFDRRLIMDPESVKPFENRGTAVLVEPNAKFSKQLTLIPAVH